MSLTAEPNGNRRDNIWGEKTNKLMSDYQVKVQSHLERVLESHLFPDKSAPVVASEGLL